MIAQKKWFIKGEDFWIFMAVAKSEKEERKRFNENVKVDLSIKH